MKYIKLYLNLLSLTFSLLIPSQTLYDIFCLNRGTSIKWYDLGYRLVFIWLYIYIY